MSKMSDHYPAGMSECDRNGMNGNCGAECGQFLRGECETANNGDIYSSYRDNSRFIIVIHHTLDVLELRETSDKMWKITVNGDVYGLYVSRSKDAAEEVFHNMVLRELGALTE